MKLRITQPNAQNPDHPEENYVVGEEIVIKADEIPPHLVNKCVVVGTEAKKSISNMTVAELTEQAVEMGIAVPPGARKADIVELIKNHSEAVE